MESILVAIHHDYPGRKIYCDNCDLQRTRRLWSPLRKRNGASCSGRFPRRCSLLGLPKESDQRLDDDLWNQGISSLENHAA